MAVCFVDHEDLWASGRVHSQDFLLYTGGSQAFKTAEAAGLKPHYRGKDGGVFGDELLQNRPIKICCHRCWEADDEPERLRYHRFGPDVAWPDLGELARPGRTGSGQTCAVG